LANKVWTMTQRFLTRYIKRQGKPRCLRCGKTIHVGDKVVSRKAKLTHLANYRIIYCRKCALELMIV
jgi:late competence protein required for DNA uptake (superfamily II DNA/RNA helicase)